MPDVGVNSVSVLGRELLLVDVGGGAETHLAATDDQPTARLPSPKVAPTRRAELLPPGTTKEHCSLGGGRRRRCAAGPGGR